VSIQRKQATGSAKIVIISAGC